MNSKAGTTSVLRKIVQRELPTNVYNSHTNYLHLIVTEQRPISLKAAVRIVESVELRAIDRDYFKTLVEFSRAREARKREEFFGKLVKLKRTALPAALERDMLEARTS